MVKFQQIFWNINFWFWSQYIGAIEIKVTGGKGVMRWMLCESELTAEVIPVDMAISGLIGVTYNVATLKRK